MSLNLLVPSEIDVLPFTWPAESKLSISRFPSRQFPGPSPGQHFCLVGVGVGVRGARGGGISRHCISDLALAFLFCKVDDEVLILNAVLH